MDALRDDSGNLNGFAIGSTPNAPGMCPYADTWELTESEWNSGDKSYVLAPDGQYIYLYDNMNLWYADLYGQEYVDYEAMMDDEGNPTDEYFVYICETYGEEGAPFCDEDGNYDPDLQPDYGDFYDDEGEPTEELFEYYCLVYGDEEELTFCDGDEYIGGG